MSPCVYTNLPTNQGSSQKRQCITWLHIHRKQLLQVIYIWAFLDTEGASDSTSWHKKAAKPHGLRDTLVMDLLYAEWQKNYIQAHRGEMLKGSVDTGCPEGHFITPGVLPGCRQSHRGTWWEWMLYSAAMCYHQLNIHDYCHRASSAGFKYGTKVVW